MITEKEVLIAINRVKCALEILELDQQHLRVPELDLANTPERIVKMWVELTSGTRKDAPAIMSFESKHDEMLVLEGISFVSLCSHHFAPFRGVVHIGYIPNGKVIGISKPARVVDHFAARPQTQELLTRQIAGYLMGELEPHGVMVVIKAEHTCISCRGARKPGSRFTTSFVRGVFLEDPSAKSEFLELLKLKV